LRLRIAVPQQIAVRPVDGDHNHISDKIAVPAR
jgi:hypothetical protein